MHVAIKRGGRHIGIMENKMETTGIMCYMGVIWGYIVFCIRDNGK